MVKMFGYYQIQPRRYQLYLKMIFSDREMATEIEVTLFKLLSLYYRDAQLLNEIEITSCLPGCLHSESLIYCVFVLGFIIILSRGKNRMLTIAKRLNEQSLSLLFCAWSESSH